MSIQTDILQSNLAAKPIVMQDSNGVEVMQGCTAWVNFTGSTGAISSSFNVSSIVRNAVGYWDITFTTPMVNADYTCCGCGSVPVAATGVGGSYAMTISTGDKTNTTYGTHNLLKVSVRAVDNTNAMQDSQTVQVAIFGGK